MADGKVSILVDLQDKKAIRSANNLGKQISNTFKSLPNTFSNFGSRVASTFEGISNKTGRIGKQLSNWGNNLSKVGGSLNKNITKPALTAGAAVAGITLAKGFQRLIGIDTARAKLVGLGHDAEGVEAIMDSALQSVKGTAHGMDEAATTAANAVAAGVKEGEDLTKYLTITGDAAAIAGASMSEMGSILNKVKTSNKAYNGELQQLSDRGLPVYQWLAEEAGVAADAVFDLASDGKISSEMLMNAIDKNIGGAAKKMGEESFTAGIANLWAAVGRLGASFLDAGGKGGGFFSKLKPLITDMTNNIDTLGDWAAEMGVKFGDAFTKMIEKIKEAKQWYDNLSPPIQDVIKKVALFGSIALVALGPVILGIAKVVTAFGTVFTAISKVTGAISKIPALFAGIGKAIAFLTSPIGLVIVAVIAAVYLIYKYWEPISEFFINLWETIKETGIAIWDTLKDVWSASVDWLISAWNGVLDFFSGLWEGIKNTSQSTWDFIKDSSKRAVELVKTGWFAIKTFFSIIWKFVSDTAKEAWDRISGIAVDTYNDFVNVFGPLISFFSDVFSGIVELGANYFGRLVDFLSVTWDSIKTIAQSAWEIIKNVILGPVLLLINLVTGNMEEFKSNFEAIFENIREHASIIWQAIKDTVVEYATMIWENTKEIFMFLYDTVVELFGAIKDTITNVWDAIKESTAEAWELIIQGVDTALEYLQEIFNTALDAIFIKISDTWGFIDELWKSALSFILGDSIENFEEIKNAVDEAMGAIWEIIENAWVFISDTFSNAMGFIMALVRLDFGVMKQFIDQQMDAISKFIGNSWEAIKRFFSDALTVILLTVKEKYSQIKQWISDKMDEISNKIKDAWTEAAKNTAKKLAEMWTETVNKFKEIVKSVAEKMTETKQKIEDGWNKAVEFLKGIDLKQIGKDIINGLIKGITSKVEAVGDAMKAVTDKITGKIKSILGIHSPSRWMRDMIGKNMMLGWQIGVEREKRSSERMAEQATEWMTPDAPKPKVGGFVNKLKGVTAPIKDITANINTNHMIALAGSSSNNSASSPHTIEIVTNLDGREVAREIVEDVTKLQDRKKYGNNKARRRR